MSWSGPWPGDLHFDTNGLVVLVIRGSQRLPVRGLCLSAPSDYALSPIPPTSQEHWTPTPLQVLSRVHASPHQICAGARVPECGQRPDPTPRSLQ